MPYPIIPLAHLRKHGGKPRRSAPAGELAPSQSDGAGFIEACSFSWAENTAKPLPRLFSRGLIDIV